MKLIILASASPRRKILLEQINLKFETHPQNISETIDKTITPEDFAVLTAKKKATKAVSQFPNALIIGCDTIVVHQNEVLGKPADKAEAYRMLTKLSGNSHIVITAIVLIKSGPDGSIISSKEFFELTDVTFSPLEKDEIHEYIQTGSPFDKAGAYGIQDDWGSVFVSGIKGDYYNVVGFPLNRFYQTLKKYAPEYLPSATSNNLQ
ncbi:MAG: Maf family protein [Balneolales bacterium]